MIIKDNIYQCELCPSKTERLVWGWVVVTTKCKDDDHLCPNCWKPVVPEVYPKSGKDRLALLIEENRHI